jgi:hypothetical protein
MRTGVRRAEAVTDDRVMQLVASTFTSAVCLENAHYVAEFGARELVTPGGRNRRLTTEKQSPNDWSWYGTEGDGRLSQ